MNDVTGPEMKIRKAKDEYTPLGFYFIDVDWEIIRFLKKEPPVHSTPVQRLIGVLLIGMTILSTGYYIC